MTYQAVLGVTVSVEGDGVSGFIRCRNSKKRILRVSEAFCVGFKWMVYGFTVAALAKPSKSFGQSLADPCHASFLKNSVFDGHEVGLGDEVAVKQTPKVFIASDDATPVAQDLT